MRRIHLDNDNEFAREVTAVTMGAATAGALLPALTSLPLIACAPAGALFGGSIASAFLLKRPVKKRWRALIGSAAGALAGAGYLALATKFGFEISGAIAGGALGGMALSTLLSSQKDNNFNRWSQLLSTAAATCIGGVGVYAATKNAEHLIAFNQFSLPASAGLAGLLGLWISTASGVRRLRPFVNTLDARLKHLLASAPAPLRSKVQEAARSYQEILKTLEEGNQQWITQRSETKSNATALMTSFLDVAEEAVRLLTQKSKHQPESLEEKLEDITQRMASCDDSVTLGHLTRAAQALRAQKSAIESVKVGYERSEAAMDAQLALLDRFRLAFVQYQTDDHERLTVELEAISEQILNFYDDLESIQAAMLEAESYSDRKLLADIEHAGRKALSLSHHESPEQSALTKVPPLARDNVDSAEEVAVTTPLRERY